MNDQDEDAASSLEGELLNNRWRVVAKIDPVKGSTGGQFSIRYKVIDIKTGQEAFLKALNYKAFFSRSRGNPVDVIQQQNSAFQYERDVLIRCKDHNLTKVIQMFDEGTTFLDRFAIPTVPFLVFELAEGDIRSKVDFSNKLDFAWKLNSLHNVAVGIRQLHGIGIGHQDLKPSNILLYENGLTSKLGDLGNSLCASIKAPHELPTGRFTGDSEYMPIEFFYNHIELDLTKRVRATDMYLFGNLLAFYFTGLNMTSLINRNIDRQFRWTNWNGAYSSVREYLMNGFYRALREFRRSIPEGIIGDELYSILEYTCFPYPEKRGHPVALSQIGNQYDFQRTISKLDVLLKLAEMEVFRHGN